MLDSRLRCPTFPDVRQVEAECESDAETLPAFLGDGEDDKTEE